MTEAQALKFLRHLTDRHGVSDGVQILSTQLNLSWNTVYGWYRRKSIPQWRVESIGAVAANFQRQA